VVIWYAVVRFDRVVMLTAALAPPEYRRRVPARTLSSIQIWIPPAKKNEMERGKGACGAAFWAGAAQIQTAHFFPFAVGLAV